MKLVERLERVTDCNLLYNTEIILDSVETLLVWVPRLGTWGDMGTKKFMVAKKEPKK